jgi:hypothetical protein
MSRNYFAGINTRPLAAAAQGQHILISYAQIKETPSLWSWLEPLLEGGHFRSAILDSGAFTELSARKRGRSFHIDLEEYKAFARQNAHHFAWIANLDDIEGDTERSNANLAELEAAGLAAAPVYHEGEPEAQLLLCIERARAGCGILAIGCQRPKGSLIPTNVTRFLDWLMPRLAELAPDLEIHGFGLTRYATDACPCGYGGFAFDSTDSTTWIAEGCALHRSGATEHRHRAFEATIDSYRGAGWIADHDEDTHWHGTAFDAERAQAAGGQARTIARRHFRIQATN